MDNLMIFLEVILLIFGILQIILFFKIWAMTNNVSQLMKDIQDFKSVYLYNIKPYGFDREKTSLYGNAIWHINFDDISSNFSKDESVKDFAKQIFNYYRRNSFSDNTKEEMEKGLEACITKYGAKLNEKGIDAHEVANDVAKEINSKISAK